MVLADLTIDSAVTKLQSFICCIYLVLYVIRCNEAHCSQEQFPCSIDQCVSSSTVCDGNFDCDNGQDEFCRKPGLTLNIYREPCFQCGDGTCISPVSMNEENAGISDWYLCDGISHCKNSMDEHIDACLRHKSTWQEKTFLRCVPTDLQFGPNNDVIMWLDKLCDGVQDCYNGMDELTCAWKSFSLIYSKIETKTLVIGILVSLIVMSLPLGFLIYKLRSIRANHRPSTSTSDTVFTQVSGIDVTNTANDDVSRSPLMLHTDVTNIMNNSGKSQSTTIPQKPVCHLVETSDADKRHCHFQESKVACQLNIPELQLAA